jgi:hypothetical protein
VKKMPVICTSGIGARPFSKTGQVRSPSKEAVFVAALTPNFMREWLCGV